MKRLGLLFLLIAASGLAHSIDRAAPPEDVSLVQLIANPDHFDGRAVTVIGFLNLEHESDALYLHSEDYEHQILKNALWIEVPPDIMKHAGTVNLQYVIVTGVFDAHNKGYRSMASGSLDKITNIHSWPGLNIPTK
jgi:hypothetical protein